MSTVSDAAAGTVGPSLLPDDWATDILVVDDDARNLLAIQVALGELGGRLVKARSGEEALRQLLERDFALILLDVQMPGMDGFQTARLIRTRERSRHVPIIFVTAFNHDDADIRRGYELGAVDYLFKPIVAEVLRAKAQVFVELRQRSKELALQATRLREMERAESERRFHEERQRWEAAVLLQQMQEQRQLNERLEEADRRKDEFIAVLAHELRNPLSPLVAGLELLRLDPTPRSIEKVRDTMERQVRHLTRLVDDLLDVSRISRGKIDLHCEPVRIEDIVEQALTTCQAIIGARGHDLVIRPPKTPVALNADPVRMVQIVSNLVNNAAHYTDPGGRIELGWELEGDNALIEVADNGCGIPAPLLERVFESFVQEHPAGKGLGLGLTLVRELVALHGGSVCAQSEGRGRGSRFQIRLPATEKVTGQSPVTNCDDPHPLAPLRILVVEDDEDVRTTIRALLEQWGHDVRAASTGRMGLELALEAPPDVVVLDLGLPELDGYGVARGICRALGDARPRLVAMSGFGQPNDRRRVSEAGFDAHLVKPADPTCLRRLLYPPA